METVEILSDYELERGKPMPSKNHGYLQANLLMALGTLYRRQYTFLSETSLLMPEKPDCVPDIAIYPKLEIDFLDDELSMTQLPLTAVEIVSPTQSDQDLLQKINRYFNAGVKSCWLVLPGFKAIHVYSGIGEYTFFNAQMTLSDPTTQIELPLSEIFS
jgi:Uma2 family endonuclease